MRIGFRLFAVTMMTFLLIGCVAKTATMVKSPGETSQYAPMNDNPNRGIISYRSNGPASAVKERLEDAYRQMYDACKGKYIIVNQDSQITGAMAISSGNVTGIPVIRKTEIIFECVTDK